MGFNKDSGKEAGKKSKRGIGQKTKEWEALGDSIRTTHANRLNTVLASLDDEEFIKAYGMILQYFKPKLASTTLDAKIDNRPQIVMRPASGEELEEDDIHDSL